MKRRCVFTYTFVHTSSVTSLLNSRNCIRSNDILIRKPVGTKLLGDLGVDGKTEWIGFT
jgi:hypothetical protein